MCALHDDEKLVALFPPETLRSAPAKGRHVSDSDLHLQDHRDHLPHLQLINAASTAPIAGTLPVQLLILPLVLPPSAPRTCDAAAQRLHPQRALRCTVFVQ